MPYRLKFEQDRIEREEAERMAVIEGHREQQLIQAAENALARRRVWLMRELQRAGKQVPLSGSIPMEKKPEKTEN